MHQLWLHGVCGDEALAETCKIRRNLDDLEASCPGITTSSAQWKAGPRSSHMLKNLPAIYLFFRPIKWELHESSVHICGSSNFHLCQICSGCFRLLRLFMDARNRGRKSARHQRFHILKVLRERVSRPLTPEVSRAAEDINIPGLNRRGLVPLSSFEVAQRGTQLRLIMHPGVDVWVVGAAQCAAGK